MLRPPSTCPSNRKGVKVLRIGQQRARGLEHKSGIEQSILNYFCINFIIVRAYGCCSKRAIHGTFNRRPHSLLCRFSGQRHRSPAWHIYGVYSGSARNHRIRSHYAYQQAETKNESN